MAKGIVKTNSNATIKTLSAMVSYRISNSSFAVRIDKKEKKQLIASKMQATPVTSSIMDVSLTFDILREVKTPRQNPNKLEEVFRICCDLFFDIYSLPGQLAHTWM